MTSLKKLKRQNIDAIRHINIAIRYALDVKFDHNLPENVRMAAKRMQDDLELARWVAEDMMKRIQEEAR
jgi:hypothetical protein